MDWPTVVWKSIAATLVAATIVDVTKYVSEYFKAVRQPPIKVVVYDLREAYIDADCFAAHHRTRRNSAQV